MAKGARKQTRKAADSSRSESGKVADSGIRRERARWKEVSKYPGESLPEGEAQRAFRWLMPRLIAMGILDREHGVDALALVIFCREWGLYLELAEEVEKHGSWYEAETEFGLVQRQRPVATLHDKAFKRVRGIMQELGLSPAARKRIAAELDAGEDPLAAFLKS